MWSVANDLKLYYKMCIIWNINPKTHPIASPNQTHSHTTEPHYEFALA